MLYKLESLRGVAACLVVLLHSPFMFGQNSLAFVSNGYLFVDFFFVLSGFVMALAYSSRVSQGMGFKEYLILRLGRVYPLHLVMLLLWLIYLLVKYFLFSLLFDGSNWLERNNLSSFVSNVFLSNSMGLHDDLSWNYPAWSISTEFYAYIVFYCLTVFFDKRNSFVFPVLICVCCYFVLVGLGRDNIDVTYDYGFFRCAGAFYVGVFVYRMQSYRSIAEISVRFQNLMECFCIVMVAILVSLADKHLFYFIPIIMVFALSIHVFSQEDSGYVGRVLLTTPFRKVGTWSYSVYMIHALLVDAYSNFFEHILQWDIEAALGLVSVPINLVLLALVILVSKYSYSLIETPFRSKSRKWAQNT